MKQGPVVGAVSADNVRRHVEHITQNIPSRLAGSENGGRMAKYSLGALKSAGAEVAIHELPGLVSFPEQTELHVLSPQPMVFAASTLGHSTETAGEGVTGEIIDVGSGAASAFEGQDARGRITLSELSYHPARHEKQRISALMGASGCVMMNWGGPDNTALPFGSVKPAWGNPTPETFRTEMATLPCIGIARTDGLRLREMIQAGPVQVRFKTVVENGWRPIQITVGEVKAEHGDDFVVIGGHQDSWPGPQATDNAAGNACLIELARVFAQHRDKLRRGLVIGLWTAHETGTMIGSTWYVDRNWDRLRRHAVAYLQIDQPSCAGTTGWGAGSNIELRRFHQSVEKSLLGDRTIGWKRAAKSGDSSFFGLGVPMLNAQGTFTEAELKATALANLGWWHHSIENTIDKLDWDYMRLHLQVYAAYLWELCTARILPFEFVSVADDFIARLEALAPAGASIGLAGALEGARRLREAASRLEAAAEHWRARYDAGETADAPADLLNECLKRLSRTLIPLASTAKGKYGQDSYGYTPQTTMIPSLFDVPALARLAEDSEERWMLETQLVRDRNRVVDGLDDCVVLIEDTLRQLGPVPGGR